MYENNSENLYYIHSAYGSKTLQVKSKYYLTDSIAFLFTICNKRLITISCISCTLEYAVF